MSFITICKDHPDGGVIYLVYYGNKYLGAFTNKEDVNDFIKKQLNEEESQKISSDD